MTDQTQTPVNNDDFSFFCPECNSLKKMHKSDIGKIIECEECCEMVKIDYPETRPCPKCKKSIKLKAKVCKYCKQRVMPFIDPFEVKPTSTTILPPTVKRFKIDQRIQAVAVGLIGMTGGFAVGLFGTRAIARMMQRCISGNADYIIAAILAVYLGIRLYRSKKANGG
jgi:hypothetical protein